MSPYIASLDGIRAVAITLVFLAHGGLADIVPGGLGVTIFFVLSGFLITTLMRVEYTEAQRLDLLAFYVRRFLRLIPPLSIVLILALAISPMLSAAIPSTLAGVMSVIFYFSNYFSIQGLDGIPNGLGVTWSLAVEEHFYIVFPLLAPALLRQSRGEAGARIALVCIAILAWRCWLCAHGAASGRIYMGTDTRLDSILVGCALALSCNPVLDPVAPPLKRYWVVICIAAIVTLFVTLAIRSEYFRFTYRFTLQSLAIATLLYFAVLRSQSAAFHWLNWGPLVYLGKISYTIYLSHQLCLSLLNDQWSKLGMAATMLYTAALSIGLAVPMRLWVDIPLAAWRKRHGRRRRAPASQSTYLANPTLPTYQEL